MIWVLHVSSTLYIPLYVGLVENGEENQFVHKSSVHRISYVDVRKWFELLNLLHILAEKRKKQLPEKGWLYIQVVDAMKIHYCMYHSG